jgi:sec-independent protein translocase protein TatA
MSAGTVMPVPSGPEWIIVLVVILVLFGSTKLPKLARSLGQAQGEFKKGIQEGATDEDTTDEASPKA